MTTTHTPSPLPSTTSTASFWHTEPSSLLLGHRSTRNLPATVDIVVVGSGITGASIAHSLLNDSRTEELNVLMLEAREACWGATGRNGGHCQPLLYSHPTDPSIAAFELSNFATIASLSASIPSAEFVSQPSVHAYYTTQSLVEAAANVTTLRSIHPEIGNRCRVTTDRAELDELRVSTALGAVVTDIAGRMWPYKFVAAVLEGLLTDAEIGGRFNLQTCCAVESITNPTSSSRNEGSGFKWNVNTARGTVRAKTVILATNGYTSHLLPEFADLIVPCRGQMSALTPTRDLRRENRLRYSYAFLAEKQDDYLIQRPSDKGEQLMFGGGRQFGHTIGVADDGVVDPRTDDWLTQTLPRVFGLDTPALQKQMMWSGIMGFSRDEVPWVGPVPGRNGVFVCAGYTGHGMPNAWLCGKAVSIMAGKALSGVEQREAVEAAMEEVKLPHCYLLSAERLERVRQMPTVLQQDHMTMHKTELPEISA
ncbi:hypothetical protein MBLNU457_1580t1 [Dothideomycetes sp. NU457]